MWIYIAHHRQGLYCTGVDIDVQEHNATQNGAHFRHRRYECDVEIKRVHQQEFSNLSVVAQSSLESL